ncbi:MAG: glutamine--fructose-6-phosphate transaminase (isomerizing) [Candidatus Saganbacteria bacterium]|nr:glutamine--fructose-6-phosphate transaminase (isomerizing) [Candidatus Saganbacteria bacterium]
MCGIIGYIGNKEAVPILLEGLKKLEYRGYDSAGIVALSDGKLIVEKSIGKISDLEALITPKKISAHTGLGHTRWATHGIPSKENAHPHSDCTNSIALVHNGIIENYEALKSDLIAKGHVFKSQTDTEVLVHLIEDEISKGLAEAVRLAVSKVQGSYAIGVIYKKEPDRIVVARKGSPLIIGLGNGENFTASDIPAIIKNTSRIITLEEGDIAVVEKDNVKIIDLSGKKISRKETLVSWDPVSAEKGGYAHFMLKEIHEQPKAIMDTIRACVDTAKKQIKFKDLNLNKKDISGINRVILTACGTSWHAALVGEYFIEHYAKIPSEVEYAAEFRYRSPIIDKNTLVIAITQSGETADTLGAVEEAKKLGAKVVSICNVVSSSIARASDGVIYTKAGPEIGVASTKAFTTQIVVLYLLALFLASEKKKISKTEILKKLESLFEIPNKVEQVLSQEERIEKIADKYYQCSNALYLGRGEGFPIALEGALKLKEISYIHAEGYPAAEMKHGPIALIDEDMPVIVLALAGRRYDKILGNIEEVKARGGKVIALATEGDKNIKKKADDVIYLPVARETVSAIFAVIPLQLFAYYVAVKRGCHVDQPRNLAKSVTVE